MYCICSRGVANGIQRYSTNYRVEERTGPERGGIRDFAPSLILRSGFHWTKSLQDPRGFFSFGPGLGELLQPPLVEAWPLAAPNCVMYTTKPSMVM